MGARDVTSFEVLAFLANADMMRQEAANRVRLAAARGRQWADDYLGVGWTGNARSALSEASGLAACELQIICELHSETRQRLLQ